MLAQHGLMLRADVDVGSAGQSYGEMAGSLIPAALASAKPVDLLVFAFAGADVAPGRSTAAYLANLCPGEPMAFAICDQGIAAPYTALRLLDAAGGAADCRRALLVVAEQATAFYDPPAPAELPARHAAVVLGFDAAGPNGQDGQGGLGGLGPGRLLRCAGLAAARDLVGAAATELAVGRTEVTLLTGNGLGPSGSLALPACVQQLAAPAGQPCTGVWAALAAGLDDWAVAGQRVLVADYDAPLGYVCIATIDVAPPAASSAAAQCSGGQGSS